uniref:Uncharacterized protein n=1 Tax=Chromera velia CCMP2878 TaxID=1169474 RepID=A0A0G4GJ70_9ALVE|eukprot:Cvel_22119.t1-p1 / transcript=Cvel_22119.t1 / gene=Cvel_22119 / organism=Chromera_velia_CCMP2878 / gene_product=hypothetical protein / transcript_product=hypothetical protein / location=Cvel_scaffold2143:5791-6435(+) / protein_length=175 / sequence_SO=supercontig / SO=protein_coding / is_pseudo=false
MYINLFFLLFFSPLRGTLGFLWDLGRGGGISSGAEEEDAFSDVDVEEVQDADDVWAVSAASSLLPQAPTGSQIQNSQLEMHTKQEGGEEKEATEGNEERLGSWRTCREGKEDGAMPPSPVASAVSGIWIGREEDTLHVQEVEKEGDSVQIALEDEKEKEDEEEALREGLEELKER